MATSKREGLRKRPNKPIEFSGHEEVSSNHSQEGSTVKLVEHSRIEEDELNELKVENKKMKEKLSILKIEKCTYRDDFLQERQDRERAVERAESLQQEIADLESKVTKHKDDYATLKETLDDLTEQLKEAKQTIAEQEVELEAAKEEIAVKVAQVKQYQKQVEAYKQELDKANGGGIYSNVNRKRKSDGEQGGATKCYKQDALGCLEHAAEDLTDSADDLTPLVLMPTSNIDVLIHENASSANRKGAISGTRLGGAASDTEPRRPMSGVHVPDDPNLQCPICREIFKKGEIQKFRTHVQMCSSD